MVVLFLFGGAPGIGKSTIPSAVIKAWNERNDESNQKGTYGC